ncbi:hypothetical protein PFC_03590 [Pyrococcus furiosus COM1]|uniref:Uncharacterized protein n=1 Tax=Pyrococcus furiosus COM1 TaxID=1185654 RepID=I6U6U0_9EURY|nr:hypothetical protein PFC_03590 [Pyrococcus furiosus COM1]
MFIDRKEDGKAQFIVIYGRRRVGKLLSYLSS